MDSPKRYEGYAIVIFIFFFLYFLFGVIKVTVQPEDMAVIGQFGDMFGAFNAGLGMLTVWLAFRNLASIKESLEEQRKLNEDQKRHEIENTLREKIEKILFQIRVYQEVSTVHYPVKDDQLNNQYLTEYRVKRLNVLKEPMLLSHLYFPDLKDTIDEIWNNDIKFDLLFYKDGKIAHDEETRESILEVVTVIITYCASFGDTIIRDSNKIIQNSPMLSNRPLNN